MKALLALLLLPIVGDLFAEGVRAYREGRYAAALEAFATAEADAGQAASAALVHNRALAALRVGRLREAEFSAEKAVVRGGPAYEGFRDFVFGSAAFVRAARAEAEAGLQDPDPTAFARAIGHAEAALDAWTRAAMSRDDWPEARRNVQRAQRKLEELRRKKEEADANRKAKRDGRAEERPVPDDPDQEGPREEVEQAPELRTDEGVLSADQLDSLLARLAEKEREKRTLRREQQAARTSGVERDW